MEMGLDEEADEKSRVRGNELSCPVNSEKSIYCNSNNPGDKPYCNCPFYELEIVENKKIQSCHLYSP